MKSLTHDQHVQSLIKMLEELGKNNSTIEEYFNFEWSGSLDNWSKVLREVKERLNLPRLLNY